MSGQPRHCRGCGCELSTIQSIRGLCDNPECRRKDVDFQQRQRRQTALRIIRAGLPASWQAKNAGVAVLPRNTKRLVPLSGARIEALRQHLEHIVIEAGELPDQEFEIKETSTTTNGIDAKQADLPVLGAACGLCGGHCCATGGDSAWLEPGTIRRLQWRLLPLADTRIIEHYLSFVPETGYENSCIYHAENGCCLPRSIRSNVCNQYLCKGLAEVVQGLKDGEGRCVAATVIGVSPITVALIDTLGILDTLKPAGED
ncbi:hypothetical protein [Methylomonas rivi]|uniref:Zinc/iron-chelating domain-containing protein n=1 Tax=Methylomonas rivi TaxID=2952226 RepID=A0ABT1TZ95_9GAMM|nr:hypothetical protein [Methylomonas sp. WSC-6]MCQ8126886.1 hypothetical protein [Methylomonas sp. WSC-6]